MVNGLWHVYHIFVGLQCVGLCVRLSFLFKILKILLIYLHVNYDAAFVDYYTVPIKSYVA